MSRVFIEVADEIYRINVNGKTVYFEDHRYCGAMICNKDGDGINEPKASSPIWLHINAWYRQGKKFEVVNGVKWCKYETEMQEQRRLNANEL